MFIDGSEAFSLFRLKKINEKLSSLSIDAYVVTAHYRHFVDVGRELSLNEAEKLKDLLGHINVESIPRTKGISIIVLPRIGTISPWSSKATDIVNRCGLTEVRRIERGVLWNIDAKESLLKEELDLLASKLYDPMTESWFMDDVPELFVEHERGALQYVDLMSGGREALLQANEQYGYALTYDEIDYLVDQYENMGRNPTDAELMMFAQVNSEHCRHKIFNANWVVDGKEQPDSLFSMVRTTHQASPEGTLVAYKDNSAVVEGGDAAYFSAEYKTGVYSFKDENIPIIMKVETHNHPTAISPFPGAATGSGGEIRDEGATGRGSKPKAGIVGFTVSNLHLPGFPRNWESQPFLNPRMASALSIMLDGPIGAASFNNEFGRPNIGGYFRSFEWNGPDDTSYGYHKPVMLAGGLGNIRSAHVEKNRIPSGTPIVVLGGPAMLIGLGGGAASSVNAGSSSAELDFTSVQRGNPEMQRRCQEVIDRCTGMGEQNPIVSIHDVGAGGLSNALPELVHDAGRGGHFELRKILSDEHSMSPMQIWCNESQERYVLAIDSVRLKEFESICLREKCLYAVVGTATEQQTLRLTDGLQSLEDENNNQNTVDPISLEMQMLLGHPPKMVREYYTVDLRYPDLLLPERSIVEHLLDVLRLPTVADKSFLITIGDRSVGGHVVRDQMVGPWQVPVADVAVTATGYIGNRGEAMSLGERSPLALINPAASARIAVAEALTNLCATDIDGLSRVSLSANWMAAVGRPGQDQALHEGVLAATDLCRSLGVSIPVGKDSMSMHTAWQDQNNTQQSVTSPLTLVVTAFSPVVDTRLTSTPQILEPFEESKLLWIDLGQGLSRLGGSCLAQVHGQIGNQSPDVVETEKLAAMLNCVVELRRHGVLLSCHDISDGGLITGLVEMAFAGRCGLEIELVSDKPVVDTLFAEELGMILQIRGGDDRIVRSILGDFKLTSIVRELGRPVSGEQIRISVNSLNVVDESRITLHKAWSETSWVMQSIRDNPECATEEYELLSSDDTGLNAYLTYDSDLDISLPFVGLPSRPKIAILREQGVNGQLEMAAAFSLAGFEAVDVTMSDLIEKRHNLSTFQGIAACGGFSFGDVLGAGQGWAKSILFNSYLYDEFAAFFSRPDSFSLGVCNGCQMMSSLKFIIPGAETWPEFLRNRSEQYEARLVLTRIEKDNNSLFFKGMQGSVLPVVVAHGEGRADYGAAGYAGKSGNATVAMRYVTNQHTEAWSYPANPNGSQSAIASVTSDDGRVTIMMPHPERVFRTRCLSWHPTEWGEFSPWMRIFRNARTAVG